MKTALWRCGVTGIFLTAWSVVENPVDYPVYLENGTLNRVYLNPDDHEEN